MITTLRDAVIDIIWRLDLVPEKKADKIIELCKKTFERQTASAWELCEMCGKLKALNKCANSNCDRYGND
jgi:hypothetical protein